MTDLDLFIETSLFDQEFKINMILDIRLRLKLA